MRAILGMSNLLGQEDVLFLESFVGSRVPLRPQWLRNAGAAGDHEILSRILDDYERQEPKKRSSWAEEAKVRESTLKLAIRERDKLLERIDKQAWPVTEMPKTFREMVAISMSRNLAVYEPRQEDRCWYTVEDLPALLSYRSGIIPHGFSN